LLNNWDKRYLDIADQIASWSKDPSTKIGAVVVGNKGQILTQGYNGFPRGVKDCSNKYNNRILKYDYIVHAEENAIYNATNSGVPLEGASMYVTGLPTCHRCGKAIIQVGIKKVFIRAKIPERWIDSWALTQSLFKEAGVYYEIFEEE
jgi:dCMP deaminase